MSTKNKDEMNGKNASHSAKDVALSYNKAKEFAGKQYTGMQIGRGHTWHYDSGVWKETKVTPDLWEINYNVMKRRAGHAPKGSGAAVGTAYHWFILSHQFVEKKNEDDYSTNLVGIKFKLAHKRSQKGIWSASENAQRKQLIQFLSDFIKELEDVPLLMDNVSLNFTYKNQQFTGVGIPVFSSCVDNVCNRLDITLNNDHLGVMKHSMKGWRISGIAQGLVNAIGREVDKWYAIKESELKNQL